MALHQDPDHWHISRIQVKAFKSFGPSFFSTFDVPSSCLAGIVGPNGCGKSNLLEAICFAAGGSTSVLRLTGRSLRDVTSTDAGSQRPEVRLHITHGKTTHVLEACLTPEDARSYRIDGKIRTGAQVKEFLKARGIVIDSTTVIQQAAVTGLSDTNNAQALAHLVAGASGLSSWNQETATARQEIARTQKALKDIQTNIHKVQSSVAAEDTAFKAAAEAAQLEQQLEQQVQELLQGLQQRQEQLVQQLQDRRHEEQQLQVDGAASNNQLQDLILQRKALATQQAEILAQLDNPSSDTGSSGSLVEQIAAAEAQAASIQAAIAARGQWAAELEAKQQQLQQQDAQCEMLQRRVTDKQREAVTLKADLAAVRSSRDAAATLLQQAQDASMQAAAAAATVQQQQELLTTKQQEAQHAGSRVQFLQQQWQAMGSPRDSTADNAKHQTSSSKELTASVLTTAAEASCAVAAATAAAAAAAAAAGHQTQHLQGLQQQYMRLQVQAQATERPLTPAATASLLAQQGSSCRTVPLHATFRLKDPEAAGLNSDQLEQLLTPLSVIAGPAVLQTLVASTVTEANRLLAAAAAAAAGTAGGGRGAAGGTGSSKKLKIWPLDHLSVQDFQQRQRAAQQQLGQQAVMLPLDLLKFDGLYRPALLRAFGGLLIAADDATAAVLVERFGLSAVTLQGTVSRKGSMTGGWTGSSGSYAKTCWTNKQRHDKTLQQLHAVRQQLSAAEAEGLALQQQRAAAEAQLASAQQRQQLLQELQEAQAEAAAAAAEVAQEQQQLGELQGHCADLQQRLQQYQAALGQDCTADARKTETDSHGQAIKGSSRGEKKAGMGRKSATVVLQQQLQAQVEQAQAAVKAAEQQLEGAQAKAEELSASIEALEVRLAAAKDPQQQQGALQTCLHTLQHLQQQQTAEAATAQALHEEWQQLQQQQAQLDQQVKGAEQQQKAAAKQVLQAAGAVEAADAAVQKLQQDLKQALQEFGCTDAVQACSSGLLQGVPAAAATRGADPSAAAGAGLVSTDAVLQQMSRRARQLQGKLTQMDVPELLPGQKEALSARLGQVAEFTAQADALKAAAAGLERQISSTAEQVYAANDVIFEDIAAGFSQLCSSLLPSLELQLVRVGALAHEGLRFRFRRLPDTASEISAHPSTAAAAAAGAADAKWHTNLGQLSGGQRTLVSLAMLLAVARTGSACGLLLLDEVDAALDEVNQARASALLRQLAHDKVSACQILCVTHNFSFQESCDGFVLVAKSESGHSVPAEQAAGGGTAAAATAAAGNGGSSKKGGRQGRGLVMGAKGRGGQIGGVGRAKRVRFAEGG